MGVGWGGGCRDPTATTAAWGRMEWVLLQVALPIPSRAPHTRVQYVGEGAVDETEHTVWSWQGPSIE